LEEAERYARKSPTTIILDQIVENVEELGLPKDAKVLVENGSSIVGRTARARRIYGKNPEEDEKLLKIAMDAIYEANNYPLRSEEHTSELQSRFDLVCRLLLAKKNIA